ncbi:MAG: S41 family peptidase [Pseudohongiellaceae bacterium]
MHSIASFRFFKATLLFISLLFSASGTLAASSNPAEEILAPKIIAEEVAILQEAYSRIHPGYDRYTNERVIARAWDAINERAQQRGGLTLGQLYLDIQSVLVLIRCDHTKAEIPISLRQFRNSTPIYLPFLWEHIEQRGFVTIAADNSPFKFGDEILEIDGVPFGRLAAQVAEYIPVDGYTQWSRRSGVAQSLEFMGGAVDHFGSLLWNISDTVEIKIRDEQGTTRLEEANRLTYDEYRILLDSQRSQQNFKDAVSFERIGEKSAYLSVDTFVNYRDPVDPDTIFGPIFKAMAEEGRDKLILDLRKNGGGSTDAERSLLSHLVDKSLRTTLDMRVATLNLDGVRQYLSSYDSRALNPNRLFFKKNRDGTYSLRRLLADELRTLRPAKTPFTGELLVLTSNDNSSASTNLIATLATHRQTTTIGEKTGGSPDGATAGIILTLTLPHSGIRTRIPVLRQYNNTAGYVSGYGISPDIEVSTTAQSFLEQRDDALEKALELEIGR